MILSMTGFARSECQREPITAGVEIRSVNSRNLDVSVRIPGRYAMLEEKVKSAIAQRLDRGRVDVFIAVRDDSEAAAAYELDMARATAYRDVLERLRSGLGIDGEIPVSLVAGANGVIKAAENTVNEDVFWPVVHEALLMAIDDLVDMRRREGGYIADDFRLRLTQLRESLDVIESGTRDLAAQYKTRLEERIRALTQGMVEIDPARISQEAAFLADRSDISEEILRARSHIDQFFLSMDSGEPAGRKLNFLLQEMNREFNTMGAKVGRAELAHRIVDAKCELEKLREQVQNIE